MLRIVGWLVVSGLVGCARGPALPSVGAGFDGSDPSFRRDGAERLLPREPEPQWHIAPIEQGAALELRF